MDILTSAINRKVYFSKKVIKNYIDLLNEIKNLSSIRLCDIEFCKRFYKQFDEKNIFLSFTSTKISLF